VPLLTLPTIATRSDRQMPPDFSDEPLSTVSAAAPADTAGSVRPTGSGAGSHVYSGPARQPRPPVGNPLGGTARLTTPPVCATRWEPTWLSLRSIRPPGFDGRGCRHWDGMRHAHQPGSDAQNRLSTSAPRAGSWTIHQWPRPPSTSIRASARSAARRRISSVPT
jgi:hypothetical protein